MSENLVNYYYNELSNTTSPAKVLKKMIKDFLDVPETVSEKTLTADINKLVRIYGRFDVYWAIIKLTSRNNINWDVPIYPYIGAVINDMLRVQQRYNENYSIPDATREVNRNIRKINKYKDREVDWENPLDVE